MVLFGVMSYKAMEEGMTGYAKIIVGGEVNFWVRGLGELTEERSVFSRFQCLLKL